MGPTDASSLKKIEQCCKAWKYRTDARAQELAEGLCEEDDTL